MGEQLFDQYTYLHFASGIIAYFWNISLIHWIILHSLVEYIENTQYSIHIINKYMIVWPGGKPKADSMINIVGDTIGTLLGWLSAYLIDHIGNKYKWYNLHIK